MNTITRLLATAAVALAATAVVAAEPADSLVGFPQAAANYQAYPDASQLRALTPSPEGYEPFHIEHYGRHGSRWLIGQERYTRPVETLRMARRNGALTAEGATVLAALEELADAAQGRSGELTATGAAQHRGIARRMARNFPQVFAPEAVVDARSTVVIRCILSMLNEVEELRGCYTDLVIKTDASDHDMYYMNNPDPTPAGERVAATRDSLAAFRAKYPPTADFARRLIADNRLIADSVNIGEFMNDLFDIAANAPSHGHDNYFLRDIFTPREVHNQWLKTNAFWFHRNGNSAITGGDASTHQIALLRNLIASADTALTSPRNSVNLRFGHEGNLIALVVLMEIDDFARRIDRLDDVYPAWKNYEIFPMAANVQLIFYRPRKGAFTVTGDDILVKCLLNEREVRLPVDAVDGGPYYRWSDLRDHYSSRYGLGL